MKKNTITIIVSLSVISLIGICGLILMIATTHYVAGIITVLVAVVSCPFLESLSAFKSRKTTGTCPECGTRISHPSCKCGWSEANRQAELKQAALESYEEMERGL